MTKILFKAMQNNKEVLNYMQEYWNALYLRIIACNGDWNKLDKLSEMALDSYFEDKRG